MLKSEGLANIARTLGNPHFRTFQIGRTCALITMWMYRMAVAWMVWETTHSATWLGIIGFLDMGPSVVISPIAGALADRVDRMTLLRATQAILMAQAVCLSLLITYDLVGIGILAVLSFTYGVATAIQQPCLHAVVPSLVPKEQLTAAFGINSVLFNLSRFVGPMVAGVIISLWGTGPAIFGNAIGNACFSICLMTMQAVSADIGRKNQRERRHNLLGDMREGFRYAARHPGIGPMLLILILLATLTFPLTQLLPGFADGVFHEGAHGLAWMIALQGIGAVVQSAYLAHRPGIRGLTSYVIVNIFIIGLGFIALTATGDFWFGAAAVFVAGFASAANRVGSLTLLQYATEGDMRGRVSSFYGAIYHGGPALGSLLIGALSDVFGIRLTVGCVGLLALAVWAWTFSIRHRLAPALETAPAEDDGAAPAAARAAQ